MACNYCVGDEPLFINDKISAFIYSNGDIKIFENEQDTLISDFKVDYCPKCGKRLYDIYQCNGNDTFRYLMGNYGENILLCIGINPSTANKEKLDSTLTRLDNFCKDKYTWVMYNVYPERALKPENLSEKNESEHRKNIKALNDFLKGIPKEKITILAAWGIAIENGYLKDCLKDIYNITKSYKWKYITLTKDKHPKHWIGAETPENLVDFDIESYMKTLFR